MLSWMTVRVQMPSDNRSTEERWRNSYVPVVSAGVGNGSIATAPVVKPRPSPVAPVIIPAPRVTAPPVAVPRERKKRQAPKPPSTGGPWKPPVGSPNGSVSSGSVDSPGHSSTLPVESSSPVSDGRATAEATTDVSVSQPTVKPEPMKRRPAPSVPHRRPTATMSQVPPASEEKEQTGREKRISVVGGGDEIPVEFVVPRERAYQMDKASPEPAFKPKVKPKNFGDVEIASLNSTETETSAVCCSTETLTEAPPGGSDGERCSESGQRDDKSGVKSAVDTSSYQTDGLVSDRSQDVVCVTNATYAENSKTESEEGNDRDSLDEDDEDMASLQKSLHLFSYNVGNLPSTSETMQAEFQSDRGRDVHTESAFPKPKFDAAEYAVEIPEEEMNNAVVSSASTSEEVAHGGKEGINSMENNSPVTSQVEPVSFRISEKDVKQKKDELASTNQPSFDTAWQSSGDGGRFRIRSVAKNVSYTDVFGEDANTRAKDLKEGRELSGNLKTSTEVTADANRVTRPDITVRKSERFEIDEQKLSAEVSVRNEIVSHDTRNSQHQQSDHETAPKVAHRSMKAELGSYEGRDNNSASADVCKSPSVDSEPAVSVECSQHVQSSSDNVSSPQADFNRPKIPPRITASSDVVSGEIVPRDDTSVHKNSGKRKTASITHFLDMEKSSAKQSDRVEANPTRDFGSLYDIYKGKTVRQPETIVIDKSNLSSSFGSLNRRVYGASRSPSEAKSAAQSAGNSSDISAAPAASVAELPRTELVKSTVVTPVAVAEPVETVSKPTVVQREPNSTSTVVRVVNGCIVEEPVSASSTSRPPPTAPKSVGKHNITVVRCEQLPADRPPSKFETAGNGYSGRTADDDLMTSANSKATPVSAAKDGVGFQSWSTESVDDSNTTATKRSASSEIPSASLSGDTDGKAGMEHHTAKKEIVIPEWRRVTTSKSMPRAAPRQAGQMPFPVPDTPVDSEPQLQASNSNISETAPNAVQPTVGETQIQQAGVISTAVPPKPSGRTAVPTNEASMRSSSGADSGVEETSCELAQARSMLRPMTHNPNASEVAIGNGDSSASMFILRSASSSSARTSHLVTDAEDRNLVEHKPAQVGIGSSRTVGNAITPSQSHGRTFKFMTPPTAGRSSTLPPAVKKRSSAMSSPTLDEADVVQTSGFDVKPNLQSKSATSTELGTKTPSPRSAVTSSQDPVKMSSPSSEFEAGIGAVHANPAAAALASLQPAKLRPVVKPLSPPKLTLHEQLMIAIRNAGGALSTTSQNVPERSRSVDASSSVQTSTAVPISRSTSDEPPSSRAAAADQLPVKPSASAPVVAAKRTSRIIEPPKPTPHEQLMMAIRSAGGMTSKKSADTDTTHDDTTAAFPSSSSNSTVAEKAEVSVAEPYSGIPQISVDIHLKHENGSSVPSADHVPPAPDFPPPPPSVSLSPSSTVVGLSGVPKAAPRRPVPAARSTATGAAQHQPVDTREALLAAIRDAAGGKGLRKVSEKYCFLACSFVAVRKLSQYFSSLQLWLLVACLNYSESFIAYLTSYK